jgi:CubicO group peptidase (beta-lactamase class C family)
MEHRTGKLRVVTMAVAGIFAVGVPWIGQAEDASQTKVPSTKSVAAQIDRLCAEWDKPDSPGLSIAVARNATVIDVRTVGSANLELGTPITPESVFQVASVSKQFTVMSILLLEQRGKLSIDDPVQKHLPEFPDYGAPLTIRHLLSHTGGLRDVYTLHQSLAAPAEDKGDWNEILLRRLAAQRGLNFAPGTDFQYNNGGYVLLATIVQRVSGMSLQDFLDMNIFKPLGMAHTRLDDDPQRLVRNRVTGYARSGDAWRRAREEIGHAGSGGDTGILSTAADLLRWEQNFIDGEVGGKALLARMTTPAVLGNGVKLPYGLGVWVMDDRGAKTIQHGGGAPGFSTQTIYYPGHGLTIVVLANFGGFDAPGFSRQIAQACLGDLPPSASLTISPESAGPHVSLAMEQLEAKAGVYHQIGSEQFMRLFVRDQKLRWARGIGTRGSLEMLPLAEDRFVIPGAVPLYFEFSADAIQCETTSPAQAPAKFERLEAISPSREQLREYTGDYTSKELDATYCVVLQGTGIAVRVPGRSGYVLESCSRDLFQTSGGEAFRFERDGDGAVSKFTFISSGVWGLSFHRAK